MNKLNIQEILVHVIEVTNPKLGPNQFWHSTNVNYLLIDICQLDDGYNASITIHYQHLNGNNEIKKRKRRINPMF